MSMVLKNLMLRHHYILNFITLTLYIVQVIAAVLPDSWHKKSKHIFLSQKSWSDSIHFAKIESLREEAEAGPANEIEEVDRGLGEK